MSFNLFIHHIVLLVLYFFCANLQSALGFVFFFFFPIFAMCTCSLILAPCLGKLELIGFPLPLLCLLLGFSCLRTSVLVRLMRNLIVSVRFGLHLAIRANLESRGWLSLLEIDHPPPAALIREFFSNLSCHIYDSNTVVRSWIQDAEFTITPRVVTEALGVLIVTDPVYPYDESPPIDEVMSHITGSSIQWGSDPRITSSMLSEIAYLFLRVACHSL